MLPTRAYTEAIPRLSPGGAAKATSVETRPALVLAVPITEVERFAASNFTRYPVHSTVEALRLIETARPRVVVVDWDADGIDGVEVCTAARKFVHTGILVATDAPARVPAALKAGCHAVLLKPFAPNLAAARLGRLVREIPATSFAARAAAALQPTGTNRVWPDTHCPKCDAPAAVSFEFHSYRRMWYACLACEEVWLGPRQE